MGFQVGWGQLAGVAVSLPPSPCPWDPLAHFQAWLASFLIVLPKSLLRAFSTPSRSRQPGHQSPTLQATLRGRQHDLSILSFGVGGAGASNETCPSPNPTYTPICLLPPSPPLPPSKLPQNLPGRSLVLSICCLHCSLMSRLMCLNLITRARWWFRTRPPPPPRSLEPRRAFSLRPLDGGRGKPEGLSDPWGARTSAGFSASKETSLHQRSRLD